MPFLLFVGCKSENLGDLQRTSLGHLKKATPSENLTEERIEYCSKSPFRCLYLPHITVLSKETAKIIAQFKWLHENVLMVQMMLTTTMTM